MQSVQPIPTDAVASKLEAARGQLAKLEGIATDAEAEAQRWRVTFEREPTAEAHANQAIFSQRARNARAAVEAHQRDVLQPLEHQFAKAERERIAAPLDAEARAIKDDFRRAGEMLCEAVKLLDSSIARVSAQNQPRFDAKQRGCLLSELKLTELVNALSARVTSELGGLEHAVIHFVDEGNAGHVSIKFNRTATVPSHVK